MTFAWHFRSFVILAVLVVATLSRLTAANPMSMERPQSIFLRGDIKSYCDIKCGDDPHTLCNRHPPQAEKCDANYKEYPITDEFQAIMLDGHNGIRNRIAGTMMASNMKIMTWNRELADMARIWLSKCEPFRKDPFAQLYSVEHEHVDDEDEGAYIFVNQNVATTISRYYPVNFPDSTIRTWYMEKNKMKPPRYERGEAETILGFFNVSNNFTQLATAMTTNVGCAMMRSGHLYALACNYFPYDGHTHTFLRGQSVSQCPNRYPLPDLKYRNLCTSCGSTFIETLIWNLLATVLTLVIHDT